MTTRKSPSKKFSSAKKSTKAVPAKKAGKKTLTVPSLSEDIVKPHIFQAAALESTEFNGTLYVSDGQSSLDGTLILQDGISDFASAVTAAAQYFIDNQFQSGRPAVVVGRSSVVHLSVHPISVIVMTSAHH
jgi:hypothetical protein